MQTRAWANVAKAGRPCQARYVSDTGTQRGAHTRAALVLRTSVGGIPLPVASVDRGPVCAERTDVPRVLAALSRVARRHGVAHLRGHAILGQRRMWRAFKRARLSALQDVQTFDGRTW